MSDQPIKVVTPQELTEEEFAAVRSLILEGAEVDGCSPQKLRPKRKRQSRNVSKEEAFCSQSSARMRHEDSQSDQIHHNWDDRSEAMSNSSEER